jgi:hypothetical protein
MIQYSIETYATKWTLQKTNDSDNSLLHKDNETLNPPNILQDRYTFYSQKNEWDYLISWPGQELCPAC